MSHSHTGLAHGGGETGSPSTVSTSPQVFDSVLLYPDFAGDRGVNQLKGWVADVMPSFASKNGGVNLNLLFRAARDGWEAKDFHRCCDNQGPTVTVIRSECGHVFGGATDESWNGKKRIYQKSNAFLFGLKTTGASEPVRYLLIPGQEGRSIGHDARNGPTFGDDLYVCSNANTETRKFGMSNQNVGATYDAGGGGPNPFTGSRNFKVAEWEVFQIV